MRKIIKKAIPERLRAKWRRYKALKSLRNWEKAGKPVPTPHIVKQLTIERYQHKTGFRVLVETGTFMGDMIEAQRYNFKEIYSIELSEQLYLRALEKFHGAKHIHLLQGDSGEKLIEITYRLREPAIFWLDGHYSGGITAQGDKDCPVMDELEAIFSSNHDHCLLIDDARCFGRDADYPSLDEIRSLVDSKRKGYTISVTDDIIRVIKKL